MDERARIPVGLPRPNPTVSYWQDPPSDIADLQSTAELPATADYVIVGSGISGASIAFNLLNKEPGARVVMLEARQACSGATGRNGGHTKAASYRTFLDHEKELSLAEAVKITRLEYANIKETHALAKEHDIDCASNPCDTVDIIYSKYQMELGKRAVERIRQVLGEDDPAAHYQIWNAEETEQKFRTPGALGSIQYEAGSLSAYAFAIGMLKLGLKKGLKLQTNTPASALQKSTVSSSPGWTVKTPRGSITGRKVILATNGFTPYLVPQLQGLIVPLQGQVVAQRPGLKMPQTGLDLTYSLIWENGYEYMITRPPGSTHEGDVIIGGGIHKLANDGAVCYGNTDDTTLEPVITSYLRDVTAERFGKYWGADNPAGRIRSEWSGIMGASADGLPYIGEIPDMSDLWISASFNGHGMVMCLKCSEALVELMTGDRAAKIILDRWFPKAMMLTKQRMSIDFTGRKDLRAPGETAFGERSRL